MSVGTCTLDETTSWVMNFSIEGSELSLLVTACGGGCRRDDCAGGGIMLGSHWMTFEAAFARYLIISLSTGW
jgi:hypothetical protein